MAVHVTGTLTARFDTIEELQRAGQDVQTNPALNVTQVDTDTLTVTLTLDLQTEV